MKRNTARQHPVAHALLAAIASLPSIAAAQEEHVFDFSPVAGNEIAWSCAGTGGPTIVLIAGGGLSAHDTFGRAYHAYDGPGRLCMYDRAGIARSTFPSPHTRTLDELVAELHELSMQQNWADLLLVAHSFGGFVARAFADRYPDEVVAMLLLDVAHEDWLPRLEAGMSAADWSIMQRLLDWNTRTFHEDYVEAQEAVRKTRLRDGLPITVLARGVPHTRIRLERMSYAGVDLYENEHRALQPTFLKLSTNAEYRIARYSSHVFDDYDPWLVIDEIKSLVGRAAK
jgi:pimeloyl-ACP methyl ester carboxylesterase